MGENTIFKAGVRFNPYVHVSFMLDTNSGDMDVFIELIGEAEKRFISGTVQWEEGE